MVTLPLERLRRRFDHAPWTALVEAAARAGYVARGVVYLSIGAIALLAALHVAPRAEGAVGAMEAWGRWPAGILLLWLVGVGLYAFSGWRALQALFDADRCGVSPSGLATRLGQGISGVTYASLAVATFGLLDAIEDLHETDDRAATRAFVAGLLQAPMGELLVTAAGLFVAGAGVGSIARGFIDHFGRGLDCERETRRVAGSLARVGYVARGLALLPAGVLLVRAGLKVRASEAPGLGGALDLLARAPFGEAVLAMTALGLMAFGLFAVLEGALRRMRVPTP
jgi:hypothetical protein